MTMEIPAEQLSALEAMEKSGVVGAKETLAEFSPAKAPAQEPAPKEPSKTVSPTEPEGGPKAPETAPNTPKVERTPESNGTDGRKPGDSNLVQTLRRQIRTLERSRKSDTDAMRQELAALKQQLATPKPAPTPVTTAEDTLKALLENPSEFLAQREKRLKDEWVAEQNAHIQSQIEQKGKEVALQAERDQAHKSLQSIEGFDAKNREDYELMATVVEEMTGIDPEDLVELANKNPAKAATIMQKAWKIRNNLPPETLAAKGAAASGGTIAGKPGLGSKVTFESLNADYKDATARGDKDAAKRIEKQLDELATKSN